VLRSHYEFSDSVPRCIINCGLNQISLVKFGSQQSYGWSGPGYLNSLLMCLGLMCLGLMCLGRVHVTPAVALAPPGRFSVAADADHTVSLSATSTYPHVPTAGKEVEVVHSARPCGAGVLLKTALSQCASTVRAGLSGLRSSPSARQSDMSRAMLAPPNPSEGLTGPVDKIAATQEPSAAKHKAYQLQHDAHAPDIAWSSGACSWNPLKPPLPVPVFAWVGGV
jgi:hypothetical protein